jgi:hypothetical protein
VLPAISREPPEAAFGRERGRLDHARVARQVEIVGARQHAHLATVDAHARSGSAVHTAQAPVQVAVAQSLELGLEDDLVGVAVRGA